MTNFLLYMWYLKAQVLTWVQSISFPKALVILKIRQLVKVCLHVLEVIRHPIAIFETSVLRKKVLSQSGSLIIDEWKKIFWIFLKSLSCLSVQINLALDSVRLMRDCIISENFDTNNL